MRHLIDSNAVWLWLQIIGSASALSYFLGLILVSREHVRSFVLMLISIAFLGTTIGVIGGLSRIGVVGQVLPAALGVIGAAGVYLFVYDREKSAVVSVAVAMFAATLFASYMGGSYQRSNSDRITFWRAECTRILGDRERAADPAIGYHFATICGALLNADARALGVQR